MKTVRLLSSSFCHTPGILRYAMTAFRTGDKPFAIKMLRGTYSLSRKEACGLLSGKIAYRVVGDVVEFDSPHREEGSP